MSEQLTAASVYDFLDQRVETFSKEFRAKGLNLPSANILRRAVRRAAPGSPVLAYDAEVEERSLVVDEKRACATFTVTTPSVDRYGDIVMPRGCLPHLKNFEKNPVGFFSHRASDMPIGNWQDPDTKELTLKIFDDRIIGTIFFHLATPESEAIFRLVKLGILKATSIGFLPTIASIIEPDKTAKKGRPDTTEQGEDIIYFGDGGFFPSLRFIEWDLTEISVVGCPANPEALAASLSRGHVEGVKYTPELRKALEGYVLKAKVWSPGFDPERVKYTGVLKMGEGELEYKDGNLVKVHGSEIVKPTTPQDLVDALTVENTVNETLAIEKDLSALDDTAGGVVTNPTDPVKEDERFDKECLEAVTALQKALCDHIEWHKTAHNELCASISNLAASNKSLGDLIDKALAESESCRVNTASAEAAYNKAWDEAKEVITSLKGGHDALVNKFLTAYGKRGVK